MAHDCGCECCDPLIKEMSPNEVRLEPTSFLGLSVYLTGKCCNRRMARYLKIKKAKDGTGRYRIYRTPIALCLCCKISVQPGAGE